MELSVISALRALFEMLGLCLIGQGTVGLLAGAGRERNAVYLLFALLTRPPRQATAWLLRREADERFTAIVCFLLLFAAWIGLAWLRKFL